MTGNTTRTFWRHAHWLGAALILLLPLAAMSVTEEVAWDPFDFILMGLLLFGACGAYELAARTGNIAYRAAVGAAAMTAVGLIWINLAVGVIGSEANPANLMFGGVLVVALLGALLSRFRAGGMARTMAAAASAQGAVGAIALLGGLGQEGASWPMPILGLTAGFVALWLLSAWLFRKAAADSQ